MNTESNVVTLHDTLSIHNRITGMLSRELRMEAKNISPEVPLTQYGIDSIAALTIAGELEDQLGLELPSTLLWDCQTVNDLAAFLGGALHGQQLARGVVHASG